VTARPLCLTATSVVQNDHEEAAVDLDHAVVVDEPELFEFVQKKFTRDRVVPTISASVSCEILGSVRMGWLSRP
jgi:hypothetical protein